MLRTTNEVDLNTKFRFLLNGYYRHRCILIGGPPMPLPKRTIFDLVALDSNRIGGANSLVTIVFLFLLPRSSTLSIPTALYF